MKTKPITFDRFVRLLMSIVLLGVIYLLINRLSSVLIPFLVAWLIAYLLYPIVHFIQYRCRVKSRAASITITILLIAGILTGGSPRTSEIYARSQQASRRRAARSRPLLWRRGRRPDPRRSRQARREQWSYRAGPVTDHECITCRCKALPNDNFYRRLLIIFFASILRYLYEEAGELLKKGIWKIFLHDQPSLSRLCRTILYF